MTNVHGLTLSIGTVDDFHIDGIRPGHRDFPTKLFDAATANAKSGPQSPPQQANVEPQPTQAEQPVVPVVLYIDGVKVADEAVRKYQADGIIPLLWELASGQIPAEIQARYPGRQIVLDQKDERGIMGEGQALGQGPLQPNPAANEEGAQMTAVERAQREVNVDRTQEVTMVQVRVNGELIEGEFNLGHTIADLRAFLTRAEPSIGLREFRLLKVDGAPPTPLTMPTTTTLEDAGILNFTLILKFT
ncbi:NSFL1 cofactor p47 [Ditylenchus destructor]|nr:NSFL1 cofactor p47 [Ditylenchus destructor]